MSLALGICLFGLVSPTITRADDAKKEKKHHQLTDEQKKLMKEMVEKYDTNKDGKLDKEEKSKISAEDKEKMKKAGLGGHHKKSDAPADSK